MTDYIAYLEDNIPISIYEYNDLKEQGIEKKIKCICGEPVFFRKESAEICNGNCIFKRVCHFSHYKDSKCDIVKLLKDKKTKEQNENIRIKTEEERRIDRIRNILYTYNCHKKVFYTARCELKKKLKECKYYNITYDDIFNDTIKEFYDNMNNYKKINFVNILFANIERDQRYFIIEDNYDEISDIIHYVCKNFDRYKTMIKQLSLIIIYYSRCNKLNLITKTVHAFCDEITNRSNKMLLNKK